jgi:hypothetical protein
MIGDFQLNKTINEAISVEVIAMLSPWVDVGGVGKIVINRLRDYVNAFEIASLDRPGKFYDFTRYRPTVHVNSGKQVLKVPNTRVFYGSKGEKHYLLVYIKEPHNNAEDLIDSLVSLVTQFNVIRYCRVGSMYDAVPHTRPIRISHTVNGSRVASDSDSAQLIVSAYQGPTTILHQLNDKLMTLGIETISLMAHLPQYLQFGSDLMGTAYIMQYLCDIYGLPEDLIRKIDGEKQYGEVNSFVSDNHQVAKLIKELELAYDSMLVREEGAPESTEKSLINPEVMEFLEEMADRFDNNFIADKDEDSKLDL